jgi:hypothetical protein
MDLAEDSVALVRAALDDLVRRYADGGLVGVSCIAAGADALFAEAVLGVGGRLVVVVPSRVSLGASWCHRWCQVVSNASSPRPPSAETSRPAQSDPHGSAQLSAPVKPIGALAAP